MRTLPVSLVILLVAVVLAAAHGCGKKEPVRLGFMAALSGGGAELGIAGRNGALLAVEHKNADGGVNGRPVELVVRNDAQDPETARKAAREFIAMNLEAVIGPLTSSMSMACVPLFNASKTLMVSPTAMSTEFSGKDDNFIRVISSTTDYATHNARSQFSRYGRRRVAAIYDLSNGSYSESWLKDFRRTFEGMGGRLVQTLPYRSGNSTVFFPLAKKLLSVKPDMVLVITNAVDAALICQQIRKLDARVPIAMSEWAGTEHFIELAGAASDGVYVSQFMSHGPPSKPYLSFVDAYLARFGHKPGFAGIAAYDATKLTLEALDRRKPGKSLKETVLEAGSFQGVTQTITIDRFGDARRHTCDAVIRNGLYLEPE